MYHHYLLPRPLFYRFYLSEPFYKHHYLSSEPYLNIFICQSHIEYRKSWTNHVDQQDPHSLAKYLEMHNTYVGQIHNINGMIDYYYEDCLPHLLQEFDDVYHDVADVVLDSMSEGSKKITEKVRQHYYQISISI